MSEYILGTNPSELARLGFQHGVWAPVTEAFLDRIGVPRGGRVLDLGSGPGFLLESLLRRVGPGGSVVALDEAERWHEALERRVAEHGWRNVELVRARAEEAELEPGSFDLVVSRWVFSFLPDPGAAVRRLARALAPGGVLAIEDYNHEGVSLFPRSRGFEAAIRATRAWYAGAGGDTWVAGRLPRDLLDAGLELLPVVPNVIAGGPDSPAFRWADLFFPVFAERYRDAGLLSAAEHALFEREWAERRADPATLFFSPIVVDVAGRKPA